jgi:ribosome-binding protein aMBF1 (putative translation factor)
MNISNETVIQISNTGVENQPKKDTYSDLNGFTDEDKKVEPTQPYEQLYEQPCEKKETIKDIDSLTAEELIKELNTYRFNNGISQLKLSKELKLSITTVNNWFCRRFKPSMLHSFKIKKFLKEKLKTEEINEK